MNALSLPPPQGHLRPFVTSASLTMSVSTPSLPSLAGWLYFLKQLQWPHSCIQRLPLQLYVQLEFHFHHLLFHYQTFIFVRQSPCIHLCKMSCAVITGRQGGNATTRLLSVCETKNRRAVTDHHSLWEKRCDWPWITIGNWYLAGTHKLESQQWSLHFMQWLILNNDATWISH